MAHAHSAANMLHSFEAANGSKLACELEALTLWFYAVAGAAASRAGADARCAYSVAARMPMRRCRRRSSGVGQTDHFSSSFSAPSES
ncbi:hypothetical protein GmRootV116_21840 [Variovorax sp. V116]